MKANRKYKEDERAVSAVIGVILMVAITVAIAATVYYYVTTMMPEAGQQTPDVLWTAHQDDDTLEIIQGDAAFAWAKSSTEANFYLKLGNTNYYVETDFELTNTQSNLAENAITAGTFISGFTTGTYTAIWSPTDTTMGTIVYT